MNKMSFLPLILLLAKYDTDPLKQDNVKLTEYQVENLMGLVNQGERN